jgi:hypothetical protein
MRLFSTVISTLALVAILAPAPASAQYADSSSFFDLHPELTKEEFEQFTAELGSILRFRQLGDTATLGRGNVEVGVQFANNTPINDSKGAFNNLGRSISVPRIIARFGVTDRVDVGAWGGLNPNSNYGLVGVDTKIALLTQGPARPVSVSIRPSITSLVGPSEVWVGNASIDVSVSRALGSLSPYAGVATSGSLAIERSKDVDLDPATADGSLAYAGLSYRWRALFVAGEVEKGALITYGFRIGTRF